jgi:hypothetical protein
MLIGDSLVTIGAFSKGRSSSPPVLHLCRRLAALCLGFGIRCYWRWIQTDRNHSDGPSRGGPLGVMAKVVEQAVIRLPQKLLGLVRALDGPGVGVAIYRFLHLCSGHRRVGDLEDYLSQIFAANGALIIVENVDIGFGSDGDLSRQSVVDRLVSLIAAGVIDGGHAGPPCASWSRVRFKRPGPPPLRDREHLWGLPERELTVKDRAKVKLANTLLMACLIILEALDLAGCAWMLEHPADPGRWPFPSIWILERVVALQGKARVEQVVFPQCSFGCPAQKLTTLLGLVCGLGRFDVPCVHRRHAESLAGLDENGQFRTRIAQAYPPPMCMLLAKCLAEFMLAKGPVGGVTMMTESALFDARAQAVRDHALLHGCEAGLPEGFLANSG